ncbi:MAG: DUF3612 domain-containing protein [Steroidobacteraceae bacterium]
MRNSHLLGAKLKTLRKSNGFTLEELSARCVQIGPEAAPSTSYLSMIESGKRTPSSETLKLLARIFQREPGWFLDQNEEPGNLGTKERRRAVAEVLLEPSFLFSKKLLQAAIPELLSQTGVTGKQFAQLLIRSHQEQFQNDFPDLERAAESIGKREFPLSVEDLMRLCKRAGMTIRWFDRKPVLARDDDREVRSMVRSFFEAPNNIYLNRALLADPARMKFDLASHIGHKVLHGGDGLKSVHATGGGFGGSPGESGPAHGGMNSTDVLHAWRDFECSFFAAALLCPKIPFRRFLAREQYEVEAATKLGLTAALVMRRMTKVSPYPYWHFFDAYPPGFLRAVYRGNDIPLPWGNMAQVSDPCPNWALFRMIEDGRAQSGSQISVLIDGDRTLLYCCHSLRTRDMAGNPHVLSVGIDLAPALTSNGEDAEEVVQMVAAACLAQRGEAKIPAPAREAIRRVANVLNIAWVESALAINARVICQRSTRCPRTNTCEGARLSRARNLTDVRKEIVGEFGAERPR